MMAKNNVCLWVGVKMAKMRVVAKPDNDTHMIGLVYHVIVIRKFGLVPWALVPHWTIWIVRTETNLWTCHQRMFLSVVREGRYGESFTPHSN
jgi:hypothetical protein